MDSSKHTSVIASRLVKALAFMAMLAMFSGCGAETQDESYYENRNFGTTDESSVADGWNLITTIKDKETGCEYIITHEGFIMERNGSDDTQFGCGE